MSITVINYLGKVQLHKRCAFNVQMYVHCIMVLRRKSSLRSLSTINFSHYCYINDERYPVYFASTGPESLDQLAEEDHSDGGRREGTAGKVEGSQ